MTINETSIAHGGEDLRHPSRGSANFRRQLHGAMRTIRLEEQRHGDIEPGWGEEIGDPDRFGLDEWRYVGIDADGLAAQLQVPPSVQPSHAALRQDPPRRGGDPVGHNQPPGELTAEALGLRLAHAPARLHGYAALVSLHDSRRHHHGRDGQGAQ